MSLMPYLLREVFEDMTSPRAMPPGGIFDRNLCVGVLDDGLLVHPQCMTSPHMVAYVLPRRRMPKSGSGASNAQNDQEGLKVNLDVQHFKPEEINVKMVDNFVVVEGKHEERTDEHGFISRQFQRRFKLPEDVDPDSIVSKLSSDGMLSIEATKNATTPNTERVIQIVQTNTPAVTSNIPIKKRRENNNEDSPPEQMNN